MDLSVILATRNRAEVLESVLRNLADQHIEEPWELLVVDNGSTDATPDVLRRWHSKLPLVSLEESHPGKSRALNLALSVAAGELLVFTDDDVRIPPNWLADLSASANQHIDCGVFCGPVIPDFPADGPRWLLSSAFAAPALGRFAPGAAAGPLPDSCIPIGPNFAVRQSTRSTSSFRTDLGPGAHGPYLCEDTAFIVDCLQRTRACLVPTAGVVHRVRPELTELSSIKDRMYWLGRSRVRLVGHATATYWHRRWASWEGGPMPYFDAVLSLNEYVGQIDELVRLGRRREAMALRALLASAAPSGLLRTLGARATASLNAASKAYSRTPAGPRPTHRRADPTARWVYLPATLAPGDVRGGFGDTPLMQTLGELGGVRRVNLSALRRDVSRLESLPGCDDVCRWVVANTAAGREVAAYQTLVVSDRVGLPLVACQATAGRECDAVLISRGWWAADALLLSKVAALPKVRWCCQSEAIASRLAHAGVPSSQIACAGTTIDTAFFVPPADGFHSDPADEVLIVLPPSADLDTVAQAQPRIEGRVRTVKWNDGSGLCDNGGSVASRRRLDAEMRELFQRASLVVLPLFPSLAGDGYVASAIAAAVGRPVVMTRTAAPCDHVVDGSNGLLVPAGDPVALAAAVNSITRSASLRSHMGANSRRIALTSCHPRRLREALQSVSHRQARPQEAYGGGR